MWGGCYAEPPHAIVNKNRDRTIRESGGKNSYSDHHRGPEFCRSRWLLKWAASSPFTDEEMEAWDSEAIKGLSLCLLCRGSSPRSSANDNAIFPCPTHSVLWFRWGCLGPSHAPHHIQSLRYSVWVGVGKWLKFAKEIQSWGSCWLPRKEESSLHWNGRKGRRVAGLEKWGTLCGVRAFLRLNHRN